MLEPLAEGLAGLQGELASERVEVFDDRVFALEVEDLCHLTRDLGNERW
jgi:hypothetical protein